MRPTRIVAVFAAMLGSLAMPVLSATTASAASIATKAPASSCISLSLLPNTCGCS
jgi:hypothetical protein